MVRKKNTEASCWGNRAVTCKAGREILTAKIKRKLLV